MIQQLQEMIRLIRSGQPFAVCTVLRATGAPGRVGHKMIVRTNGTIDGTIGGGSLEETVKRDAGTALQAGEGSLHTYVLSKNTEGGLDSLCGGKLDVAIEIVPARPNLLLAGAGHVARAVGQLCHQLEYPYSVIDDREEMTRVEDWPGATDLVTAEPGAHISTTDVDHFTHLLLLNYSYRHDAATLQAALEKFDGIIGMIGSSRKRDRLYEDLPPELRTRTSEVRCPIGLDIPASSPAEIAVAILAQVMQDRVGTEGG